MSDARPIPDAALRDVESVEMLRVWIAEHGLHCSMKVGMYEAQGIEETRAWGIMLADVVRHVSRALELEYSQEPSETVKKIRGYFLNELDDPSSTTSGQFV